MERKKTNLIYYCILGIFALVFLFLACWGAYRLHNRKINSQTKAEYPFRLPGNIVPHHYDIQLEPHANDNYTFTGKVAIQIEVKQSTDCVVLNAEDLQFKAVLNANNDQKSTYTETGIINAVDGVIQGITLFNTNSSQTVALSTFSTASMKEYRIIKVCPANQLERSHFYLLTIEYSGPIRSDMRGFYRSKASDGSLVLSTQFESEDGRAAIPMFDEPKFKATFQMTIITPVTDDKTRILFNTDEIERTTLSDGRVKVKFDKTPLMSSYLVAFIIGQYDYVEEYADGIRHRVYTPVGKAEHGRFSLGVAVKVTKFFTETYQVKYPISKMDQIAIPDFESGAMENWGLITYRETYLYFDNMTASQSDKENGAEVVSHEISHQWNGNTITAQYWTELWINEGFATFMETYGLTNTFPSWNRELKKLTNSYIYAMDIDSVPSSDPIVRAYNKTQSNAQIDALFNSITYDKGGAILKMYYHYLGEEKFIKWIRDFYATYKYQNGNTTQLLAKLPVSDVAKTSENFATWLYQPGFPILGVNVGADGAITVSQKRFFGYANSTQQEEYSNSTWWIPLTYVTEYEGDVKSIEFPKGQTTLKISDKVLKFNHHKQGFYRVNYPKSMWVDLIKNVEEFETEDRFDLLNDIFAISTSTVEEIEPSLMFDMLLSLKNDDTNIIWENIYQWVLKLHQLLAAESVSPSYFRMVRDFVKKKYEEIGWENTSELDNEDKELRPFVLTIACRFDYEPCVKEAIKRYHERNITAIPPELRSIVYRNYIINGGEMEYHQILEQYKAEVDPNEKSKLMYALAYSKQIPLLQNTLELSLSPIIKAQDAVFLIREVARNVPFGTEVAWDFFRTHYSQLVSKCGQGQVSNRLIIGVASMFNNAFHKAEVESFLAPYLQNINLKYYYNTLEAIEKNTKFLEKHLASIDAYLKSKYPPTLL